MKVAADPEAPPFLSKSADGGWQGFEYGIMLAMSDRAGASVEIVPGQFDDLPDLVKSGAADMAIGQMSPSAAYEGLAFSTSYLQYSLCLVVQKGSKAKALGDLAGKRIGMYDDPVARQLTDVLVGASYDRQLFDDYGYFDKLAAGGLDAMVYDCPLARYELERWKDKLEIVNDRLNVATYNVAVRSRGHAAPRRGQRAPRGDRQQRAPRHAAGEVARQGDEGRRLRDGDRQGRRGEEGRHAEPHLEARARLPRPLAGDLRREQGRRRDEPAAHLHRNAAPHSQAGREVAMWRLATAADDPAVLEMFQALYREDPSPDPVPDEQLLRTLRVLRDEPVRGRAIVLEVDGQCVGYALLVSFWSNELGGEVANVDELYVAPDHRGRGAATRLVEQLSRGELWGGVPVAIDLEVTPDNHRARALYERLGFTAAKNMVMRQRP